MQCKPDEKQDLIDIVTEIESQIDRDLCPYLIQELRRLAMEYLLEPFSNPIYHSCFSLSRRRLPHLSQHYLNDPHALDLLTMFS